MIHSVPHLTCPPPLDAAWDASPWKDVPSIALRNHMGDKPDHFPNTEARIAYDETSIYVMFRVEDRYVRAVAARDQDAVCLDSCVEFFFTPGPDVSQGYFNIEMNCGGTMLFHFQKIPRKDGVALSASDCARIRRHPSMPRRIDPEIEDPVTWTVAYEVPLTILASYCQVVTPAPGVTWRANFYKCGDHTSHPHWLTWAPARNPTPDFHRPDDFGVLEFE